MPVTTTHAFKQYNGNGATKIFAIDFQFFSAAELLVTAIAADGTETVKAISTDYSVQGGGGSTGQVTMLVAPATGTKLRIERMTALTQLFSWARNDKFSETSLNRALDRMELQLQEFDLKLKRALKQSMASYVSNGEADIVDLDELQVGLTGAVLEADYDAQSVLVAISDNTPVAVTVGASSFVGRKATGDVGVMTASEARTVLNVQDGATDDLTASEILTAIKTVDGASSGLDADLLDGNHASAFALAGHDHDLDYQPLDADLTALAGVSTQPYGRSLLTTTDELQFSQFVNLEIGVDVQEYSAMLDLFAALADPGGDRLTFWDDSESEMAFLSLGAGLAISTTTLGVTVSGLDAPSAFGSGDKLWVFESGVLKVIDYDDLPGAGGGIANVVEDTSPQLGGDLDANGNLIVGGVNAASLETAIPAFAHGLVNGKIVESHTGNAATFALKGLDGNDPSSTNPVLAVFPDGSTLKVTSALSLTVSSGSTLAASSGAVAFNVWVALVNNSGTPLLAVRQCANSTGVAGFPASGHLSTTAEGGAGGADSAKVTYASSAVTDKPFIIAAVAQYESGLTTAGAWDASPTAVRQWKPGMAKPGDAVQTVTATGAVTTTTSTTPQNTNAQATITPTSKSNRIRYFASGTCRQNSSNDVVQTQMYRDSTAIGFTNSAWVGVSADARLPASLGGVDAPNSVSAIVYQIKFNNTAGAASVQYALSGSIVIVEELMA